eukprot:9415552-Pyramimonas_sp.AAC.1
MWTAQREALRALVVGALDPLARSILAGCSRPRGPPKGPPRGLRSAVATRASQRARKCESANDHGSLLVRFPSHVKEEPAGG